MIELQDLARLGLLSRIRIAEDGCLSLRYCALDPADVQRYCPTDGSGAIISLLPFREHVARLCRAIRDNDDAGLLVNAAADSSWQAVRYALQMAASLNDLQADTSYVDDTESLVYCSGAAKYEDAHSEIASKYMAGLTLFSFVWTAYEHAVDLAAAGRWPKMRLGLRVREILKDDSGRSDSMPYLRELVLGGWRTCASTKQLAPDLKLLTPHLGSPLISTAAEVSRLFRNHVAHGDDEVPMPSGGDRAIDASTADALARFYAVGRLLLMLIQVMARLTTTASSALAGRLNSEDVFAETQRFWWHVHVEETTACGEEPRLPNLGGWTIIPCVDD